MRHAKELTKKQKKHIRELASVSYERELAAALDKLLVAFQKWKEGGISPFELNEQIHKYHNGTARDLFKQYAMGDPDMVVMFALAEGILKIEDLNEDCRTFYRDRLDRFQKQ